MRGSWSDNDVEQYLQQLGKADSKGICPAMSRDLVQLTVKRIKKSKQRSAGKRVYRWIAAACLFVLILQSPLMGVTMEKMKEIFGIRVKISSYAVDQWLRDVGFQDWIKSPGAPPFLSEAETKEVAQFPLRVPKWLPEGAVETHPLRGAYARIYQDSEWVINEDSDHFFASQSFRVFFNDQEYQLGIIQAARRGNSVTMPPNTKEITVAGYPGFVQEVPYAEANAANELKSSKGELPDILGYKNHLTIWVKETTGEVTAILLASELPFEGLVKIAESMF